MAGPGRFGLPSDGVKVRCLTTWLWPYNNKFHNLNKNGGGGQIRTAELVESGFTVHRV